MLSPPSFSTLSGRSPRPAGSRPPTHSGSSTRVETAPAHRSRGLGNVAMRSLAPHALQLGADTGVLVATDDGHRLYRALGWTVRTPVAAAYIPEPRSA
ncbi:GNAT family N-acetyltransferase [Micromonospora sp. NPDC048898]|uniref:GNAT family N-acetyltransferase n=1 Tax=Micromonospora sp. NPDC048898 TaxID=3364260 RepID=UPI003722B5BD